MQSIKSRPFLYLLTTFAILFFASACSHKQVATEPAASTPAAPAASVESAVLSSDAGTADGLQTIHFAYNSYKLSKQATAFLRSNAKILKKQKDLRIEVEGHCDQRGTDAYNMELGEQRAKVAAKYLEQHGIARARISTVSFGSSRPIDPDTTTAAYAKNRRANFVIVGTAMEGSSRLTSTK